MIVYARANAGSLKTFVSPAKPCSIDLEMKAVAELFLRALAVLLPICVVALFAAGWARVDLPLWLNGAFVSFVLISGGGLSAFFPSVVRDLILRAAPREESARQRYVQAHSEEHYATIGRVIGAACLFGGLLVAFTMLVDL